VTWLRFIFDWLVLTCTQWSLETPIKVWRAVGCTHMPGTRCLLWRFTLLPWRHEDSPREGRLWWGHPMANPDVTWLFKGGCILDITEDPPTPSMLYTSYSATSLTDFDLRKNGSLGSDSRLNPVRILIPTTQSSLVWSQLKRRGMRAHAIVQLHLSPKTLSPKTLNP
jgi:hypothetical protein